MSLQKCVALITGGVQGFGRAFTETLLKQGAKVAVLDINRQKGIALEEELKSTFGKDQVKFLPCDVTNTDQLHQCFEDVKSLFGSLNIVCNNAGILSSKIEDTRKIIDINLTAQIQGTYKGIELMSKKNGGDGGVVINLASAAGVTIMRKEPLYTASKHGVVSFTRSFEYLSSFEEDGVRVNCLCPFVCQSTDMAKNAFVDYDEDLKNFYLAMGSVDIADVVKAFMRCINEKKMNANAIGIYPHHKVFDLNFPMVKPAKL